MGYPLRCYWIQKGIFYSFDTLACCFGHNLPGQRQQMPLHHMGRMLVLMRRWSLIMFPSSLRQDIWYSARRPNLYHHVLRHSYFISCKFLYRLIRKRQHKPSNSFHNCCNFDSYQYCFAVLLRRQGDAPQEVEMNISNRIKT